MLFISYITSAKLQTSSSFRRINGTIAPPPASTSHPMPEIALHNKRQHEQFLLAPGVWMLGSRKCAAEEKQPALPRLTIQDPDLPEDQLQIEVGEDGGLRLKNLGRSLTLDGGRRVGKG